MKLKKKYGFWQLFALAITATLGSSILISFGQVAFQAHYSPILMIAAWILGAFLVLPEILLLSEGATSYPENGSSYFWIKKARWNACAFWFGWVLVLFIATSAVASACLAFGSIVSILLNLQNVWYGKSFGLLILIVLFLMHVFVKKSGGRSQLVFLFIKMIPIAFIMVVAIIYGNGDSFKASVISKDLGHIYISSFMILPATTMTIFAYSGIEAVTYVSGEVVNPRKNIPKAMFWATIAIAAVYIMLVIGLLLLNLPSNAVGGKAFINDWYYAIMHNGHVPHIMAYIFSGLASLIFIGSLNSFLLYQSRLIHKMAVERDLWGWLSKTTKKTNVPYMAMIFLILTSSIFVLSSSLYSVTSYFIIAVTILKFITMVNIVHLRRKDKDYKPIFKKTTFVIATIISFTACIIAFLGSILGMYYYSLQIHNMWKLYECLIVMGVMIVGFPIYYLKNFVKKCLRIMQKMKN